MHLRDINIELSKGKSVALVGESGSGKSTLCPAAVDCKTRTVEVRCDGVRLPKGLKHLAEPPHCFPGSAAVQ
ncbi:MAG: ATP-binding cassette domain-containing protein [Cyanobacteriota/Melainabacteria group bacterium]